LAGEAAHGKSRGKSRVCVWVCDTWLCVTLVFQNLRLVQVRPPWRQTRPQLQQRHLHRRHLHQLTRVQGRPRLRRRMLRSGSKWVKIVLSLLLRLQCLVTLDHTPQWLMDTWRLHYILRESKTTQNVLWSRASVCLSVRGRTPTLLHGHGCNLGAW